MLQKIILFIETLPFHRIYKGERRIQINENLQKSQAPLPPSAFLNIIALLSLASLPLSFFAGLFLFPSFEGAAGISLIIFSLCLYCGFLIPKLLSTRQAQLAEADLPLALRAISLHLRIGVSFEKAIEHVAISNYSCSKIFADAMRQIGSGASVPSALSKAAASISSVPIMRAFHQLCAVYESGAKPDALDSLAQELISRQHTQIKLQASRAAIFSLLFVAASSLLPAFFLILNISAGPLLGFKGEPFQIWAFYLLLLPAINILALALVIASAPSLASSQKQKQILNEAKILCEKAGFPPFSTTHLILSSILLCAAGFILPSLLGVSSLSPLFALLFASLPSLSKAYFEGKATADASSIEQELPGMLFSGATSQSFSLEKMLSSARAGSPLAEQSKKALRQINAGANPLFVLEKWANSTSSPSLGRALLLLMIGYKTGGSMQKALSCAADDLLSSLALVRERAALLSIQNYTILAASAFLIPAILAVSLSFSSQISQISAPSATGENSIYSIFDFSSSSSLIAAARAAIPAYLIINAALAAFFIALSQGAREKFLYYFSILAIVSQIVWLIASG
ncbi:hypothetical protein COU37_00300 [Candidatus Micrarchaeota archaeon CG10_big_fil_rev_8_21_14_0_10_45_29]|nr:MAG: hypothetical protein COU37_00300 [Candidatus Micrarchaeota archaeon CG10_big_fil_rev_8_21_14_0_10_45_29]